MKPTIICGKVSKYKKNSEKFGLPTLEVKFSTDPDLDNGSYACRVLIDKTSVIGAMHYGPRLTEGEKEYTIDIVISDAKIELEGENIVIEVFDYLRKTTYFDSINSLVKSVTEDFERASKILRDK